MLSLLDAVAFAWIAAWAAFALRRMARGDYASILPVLIVSFVFTAIPLLLDHTFGLPEYRAFPGFSLASRDPKTNMVYDLYVSAVPVVMWIVGRPRRVPNATRVVSAPTERRLGWWRWLLYLLLAAPLIALLFAPAPSLYLTYAPIVSQQIDDPAIIGYHSILALVCLVAIIAATALLMNVRRITPTAFVAFILPWLALAVWLHGKRSIVVILIAAMGYVAWERGLLIGRRFVVATVVGVAFIAGFSFLYQSQVRGIAGSGANVYENVRIDYGRDAQIKMTLYAELYPDDLRILEYRGQSLLFDATIYVPRSVWPDKPLPYAQYFTSALFFSPPKLWGWGMTTSWLEEAIANLGWAGLLVGPMVPALVCRVGDARGRPSIRPVTVVVAMLLLTVQLVAFFPLALVWLAMVVNPFRAGVAERRDGLRRRQHHQRDHLASRLR